MAVDQSICSFEGCDRKVNAKGLCKSHRTQQLRGRTLRPIGSSFYNVGKTCYGPKCDRSAAIEGLCRAHHDQSRSGKDLSPLESRRKARPGSICTFEGCGKPRHTWELCLGHYAQLIRGEELTVLRTAEGESLRRFWARVDRRKPHECWPWMGKLMPSGYGVAGLNGDKSTAHRLMWAYYNGPVPKGTVVDHTCSNRSCVNPAHLRVVKQQLNAADRAYYPKNTSGYRNVHFDRARKLWAGAFRYQGKKVHVGRFKSPEEASRAVESRKIELYGYRFRDSLDGTK